MSDALRVESDLSAMLEANPNPVLRVASDYRVLFANSAARRCGALASDGATLSAEFARALTRLANQRETSAFEVEAPTGWLSFSVVPTADGSILDLFGAPADASRGEASRLEEQARVFAGVLHNAGLGIGAFDEDARLLAWNEEYQKVLRLPDELLVEGRPLSEIAMFIAKRGDYGPGDPDALVRERIAVLTSGETIHSELQIEGGQVYDVIARPSDTGGFVVTYSDITERKRELSQLEHQQKLIMEMSTPVTQVWEGMLLLPVVGLVDSKRANDIMNAALTEISGARAKVFVLDIGGVAVVDSTVANYLVKVAKATALMGCECVISGVSAAVAQTIVELGVEVSTKTTASLEEALRHGFERIGTDPERSGRA